MTEPSDTNSDLDSVLKMKKELLFLKVPQHKCYILFVFWTVESLAIIHDSSLIFLLSFSLRRFTLIKSRSATCPWWVTAAD